MIFKKMFFLAVMTLFCTSVFAQKRTLYIGPQKVSCVGLAPMSCLQYKDSLGQANWHFWYDSIAGFKYTAGNEYVIEVLGVDVKRAPADASSKKWILKRVIYMHKVAADLPTYQFSWVMDNNQKISLAGSKAFVTINEKAGMVNGKATCNSFFGKATWEATEKDKGKVSFGPMGSTMMACNGMDKETAILAVFEKANQYEFTSGKLLLKKDEVVIAELIRK